ncbi:MAG: copper amine oxidase N-terminal domain-containing protein [Caldisericia bacterium]
MILFTLRLKDTSIHVEMRIGSKVIKKNDEEILVDAAPYLDDKVWRTMVPIRHITEVLGAYVEWDGTQGK